MIDDIDFDEMVREAGIIHGYRERYLNAPGYFDKLYVLRDFYKHIDKRNSDSYGRLRVVHHNIDFSLIFSPIEENVWCDMRYLGLYMYPQYPVGRYYLDFADPMRKIAIECDGKQFHQDKQKDIKRHNEIEDKGWTIYHITGAATYRGHSFYDLVNSQKARLADWGIDYDHGDYEDECDWLYSETSEGIIVCIKLFHYPEKKNFEVFYAPKTPPEYYLHLNRQNFFKK